MNKSHVQPPSLAEDRYQPYHGWKSVMLGMKSIVQGFPRRSRSILDALRGKYMGYSERNCHPTTCDHSEHNCHPTTLHVITQNTTVI